MVRWPGSPARAAKVVVRIPQNQLATLKRIAAQERTSVGRLIASAVAKDLRDRAQN